MKVQSQSLGTYGADKHSIPNAASRVWSGAGVVTKIVE
jgi:hypothetical protein